MESTTGGGQWGLFAAGPSACGGILRTPRKNVNPLFVKKFTIFRPAAGSTRLAAARAERSFDEGVKEFMLTGGGRSFTLITARGQVSNRKKPPGMGPLSRINPRRTARAFVVFRIGQSIWP